MARTPSTMLPLGTPTPDFRLPDFGRTAAELSADEKNRLSHRAIAVSMLVERLRGEGAASATSR